MNLNEVTPLEIALLQIEELKSEKEGIEKAIQAREQIVKQQLNLAKKKILQQEENT